MPIRILTILFIGSLFWAGQAPCENGNASTKKETLSFKDPFSSPLPKKKIIPKKVEERIPVKPVAEIVKVEREIIPPSLSIQGLIWNTDRPQAIINESVVGIGDTIEGAKIVSIQKTGVSIAYEGKTFQIKKDVSSSTQSKRRSGGSNQNRNSSPFPEENRPFEP
ncbi:MAG TPA: hypothetical protein PL155_07525 [Candidatus Omnitrophota bacterium]|nr:hypothetical protein [Candidatus Omnitrophota bacterium]HPD85316.1 hypothetical protein [Candidatus Omnitrophota bacterium]HRZ04183.1 hypothetical protein [Candidatus Omnitrophota bacterium]